MIIAIDGPAGSGKSTTARAVARRLGFHHLDSGAFYRALTYAVLEADIAVERWPMLTSADLDALDVRAHPQDTHYRLLAGGEDITDRLRSHHVNEHVSYVARVPAVRSWLLDRLRGTARHADVVADGRDIGTVVFPDAQLKIFLDAELETRARRRLAQHGLTDPDPADLEAEVRRLRDRDRIDTERDVAPLRRAADAVVLDTTGLSFDEQVAAVTRLARTRMGTGSGDAPEHADEVRAEHPSEHPPSDPSEDSAAEPSEHPASDPSKHPASEPPERPASEPSARSASEHSEHSASDPSEDSALDPPEHPASEDSGRPEP